MARGDHLRISEIRICSKCSTSYAATRYNQKFCPEHGWRSKSYRQDAYEALPKSTVRERGREHYRRNRDKILLSRNTYKLRKLRRSYWRKYYKTNKQRIKERLYQQRYPSADIQALITVIAMENQLKSIKRKLNEKA